MRFGLGSFTELNGGVCEADAAAKAIGCRRVAIDMRPYLAWCVLAGASVTSLMVDPARAATPVYVVINIDVAPDRAAEGRAALIEEGRLSRHDAGFISWKLLQRTDRDNHFVIVEAWSSEADFDKHVEIDHARAARQKLQPILASPYDERTFKLVE